jgi:hypothetical protein
VLYLDVAKVDRDVAHVVMAIHVCFKCMFQMFICSKRMLQVFYLAVTKADLDVVYTCMLQAYVSSVFRCFIRMFACVLMLHMFAMVFKMFFRCFHKYFGCLFKCFICLLLYVATGCFKSKSGFAHRMCVGSGRRHGRRLGQHG